jgi:hypothetical protein
MNKFKVFKNVLIDLSFVVVALILSFTIGIVLLNIKLSLYPELINSPEELYLSCLAWGTIIGYGTKIIVDTFILRRIKHD